MVEIYLANSTSQWIDKPGWALFQQAWVFIQQIFTIIDGAFLLVLWHELVLHLAYRVKCLVVLVRQAAQPLLLISIIVLESAGRFTEVLILRWDVVACRVLIGRVYDSFESCARSTMMLEHFRWVTWQIGVRTLASLKDWLHERFGILGTKLTILELELMHV